MRGIRCAGSLASVLEVLSHGVLCVTFLSWRWGRRRGSYNEKHYLLILDRDESSGRIVVADPHPLNDAVYTVAPRDVVGGWKRIGQCWAAGLSPQDP
jgi:hypothetical protein